MLEGSPVDPQDPGPDVVVDHDPAEDEILDVDAQEGVDETEPEYLEPAPRSPLTMVLAAVVVLMVLAIGVLGYFTYQQSEVQKRPQTLTDVKIRQIKAEIAKDPNDPYPVLSLAGAYFRLKQYDKAVATLQQVKSMGATGTPLALSVYAIARIDQERGKEDVAIAGYEDSLKIAQTDDANYALGEIEVKKKQWDKAIEHMSAFIKNNEGDTNALKLLAAAYEGKGDKQNALKTYELSNTFVPNDASTLAAIKRLKGQK
jgi:tetratricopeptide (TPR) repeat protein